MLLGHDEPSVVSTFCLGGRFGKREKGEVAADSNRADTGTDIIYDTMYDYRTTPIGRMVWPCILGCRSVHDCMSACPCGGHVRAYRYGGTGVSQGDRGSGWRLRAKIPHESRMVLDHVSETGWPTLMGCDKRAPSGAGACTGGSCCPTRCCRCRGEDQEAGLRKNASWAMRRAGGLALINRPISWIGELAVCTVMPQMI